MFIPKKFLYTAGGVIIIIIILLVGSSFGSVKENLISERADLSGLIKNHIH